MECKGLILNPELPTVEPPVVGSDANWYDRSRQKDNGTLGAGVTWDKIASGIYVPHFTGAANSQAAFSALAYGLQEFTLSVWISHDILYEAGGGTVYLCSHLVTSANYMNIWWSGGTGKLFVEKRTGGVNDYQLSTIGYASWPAHSWYYITTTYSVNAQALYVNAILVDSSTNASGVGYNAAFYLGNKDTTSTGGLDGRIAIPKVNNRCLTASQIFALFQKERHLFGV